MHKPVITFTLLLTACDWLKPVDPCADGSPFAPEGSQVAADCQQCGQSPCPDETGETGDGAEEMWCTTDNTSDHVDCVDWPAMLAPLGGWVARPLDSCHELSQPYDGKQLGAALGVTFETYLCEAFVFGAWTPTEQAPSNDGWHLCWNPYYEAYRPASTLNVNEPTPDWVPELRCSLEADIDAGPCPLGFVDYFGESSTCKCTSDADCQPGTVCEGNYTLVNSQIHPTECTWDGAPLSAGPEVYGLSEWSDGIVVEGDDITISLEMLAAILPMEGRPFALFNDDQRVDDRGTITHCGPASLCSHLGLRVGDRLVPRLDIAELAGIIEVIRPKQRSRWLTVSVE